MTVESNITNILVDTYDPSLTNLVKGAKMPVVVKFTAEWCGPCKQLQPILERVAARYKGRILVVQVDTEASETCARHYGVMTVPALFYFGCDGELVTRTSGMQSETILVGKFEALLAHGCVGADAQQEYKQALVAAEQARLARIEAAEAGLEHLDEKAGNELPEAKALEEIMRPLNEAVDEELKDERARFEAGELDGGAYFEKRMEVAQRLMGEPRFAELVKKTTELTGKLMNAMQELPALKAMQAEIEAAQAEYDAAVTAAEAKLAVSAAGV